MLKMVRWIRGKLDIPPARVWNFDEIRIYSLPQDLHSYTLEFASVRDPMVRKIQNPKEAFTGIIMINGDGSELMVFLVTMKGLPAGCEIHKITVEERTWKNKSVKVTPVEVQFAVLHGVTVIKAPVGKKAWCSSLITQAFLKAALFRIEEHSILQVSTFIGITFIGITLNDDNVLKYKL